MTATYTVWMDSPIGALELVGGDGAVTAIEFKKRKSGKRTTQAVPVLAEAVRQLEAYFSGRLRDFDLPLAPSGTPFQQKVWKALRKIPYGGTISYGELAARVGSPNGQRAVGAANGQNPIPIIIPCHRVIGSNGTMTGYGGGIPIKRKLLSLEGALLL